MRTDALDRQQRRSSCGSFGAREDERLLLLALQAARSERDEARGSLSGTGARSERIRTYNFPDDRVTDHRVGTTLFGVGRLLDGGGTALAGLHEELATQEREEAIAALLRDAEQARR